MAPIIPVTQTIMPLWVKTSVVVPKDRVVIMTTPDDEVIFPTVIAPGPAFHAFKVVEPKGFQKPGHPLFQNLYAAQLRPVGGAQSYRSSWHCRF